ncbi:MAG: diguanylate cyclase [Acidimicrobiales bacterium]|nr:diguanylate cyclase [Acidimicrobiales bacterium]
MTTRTVLVAEDSSVIRAVLRRTLEQHAYAVIEADNGEAALSVCACTPPDTVLLDIEMPALDGYQVLTALKADPRLADIPVVFLTGRTDIEDIVEGLRLGAHDYLRKPFEPSELLARVSAAVRVKLLQDELKARNVELDRVSRRDPLTGLANRREIDERLEEAMSLARRRDEELAVLILDIDHFKGVNDTFGHEAGDHVLREFSSRLHRLLRTEDIAGRWGGEEFIVILGTDLAGGSAFGERVRESIASTPFALGEVEIAVTVSIGCTTAKNHDHESVVRRADQLLYKAKSTGRNRVVAAQ